MRKIQDLPDTEFHNHAGEKYKTAKQRAEEDRAYVMAARYGQETTNDAMTRIYDNTRLREMTVLEQKA